MPAFFQHDCGPPCCTYAGSTNSADVYLTKSQGIIIRKSDEGSDYRSFPIEIYQRPCFADDLEVQAALALVKVLQQ